MGGPGCHPRWRRSSTRAPTVERVEQDFFPIESWQQGASGAGPSMRCPRCRQIGTFEDIPATHDLLVGSIFFVQRRCPNPTCHIHIFAVRENNGELIVAYPPELIDFDPDGIPQQLVDALAEAIVCYAHKAYRASAMMVRKTLEELCDARGATGPDLYQRIEALGQQAILSPALMASLHNLRLLGNDAAHIEVRTYNDVGPEECAVAIDLTKTILNAVYQHKGLVERLAALRRPPERPPGGEA
jgi:Domain of unknown function (DUF4145)